MVTSREQERMVKKRCDGCLHYIVKRDGGVTVTFGELEKEIAGGRLLIVNK